MWATFALVVLFSDAVGDIRRLLGCLGSPRCPLALLEVTEVLHCMATLLLAMRNRGISISNRSGTCFASFLLHGKGFGLVGVTQGKMERLLEWGM